MEFLAPLHPQIVHTPVTLIIFGAVFELIGRATDLAWWRKAAFAMLVIGVLGAGAAVLSGNEAGERADQQGVPEPPIGAHEDTGRLVLWVGIAAVLARAVAPRLGGARPAVAGLALLLHLGTAVLVGITGFRGGKLVYEHAAGVHLNGKVIRTGPPR